MFSLLFYLINLLPPNLSRFLVRYAERVKVPTKMMKFRKTEKGSAPSPIIAPISINISAAIRDDSSEREVFPSLTVRDTTAPPTIADTIIVIIANVGDRKSVV